MNRHLFSSLLILALLPSPQVFSQDKLALDDRSDLLNPGTSEILKDRLAEEGVEFVTLVDFTARCDYYFGELRPQDRDVVLSIRNCDDRLLGARNLGSRIRSLPDGERAFLIAYSVSDILAGKEAAPSQAADPQVDREGEQAIPGEGRDQTGVREGGDLTKARKGRDQTGVREDADQTRVREDADQTGAHVGGNDFRDDRITDGPVTNEHDTRYFFAPTAFNLRQGQLYYNTVYFFLHDIQYGVTDHFSFGMGTTLIGLPVYFTPKFSIPAGERSAFALGDMLIVGTYGTDAIGNLAYGSFSRRGDNGNLSLGGGYLLTNDSELTGRTSSGVINLSGITQVSPYIYLLTENYFFGVNTRQSASLEVYDQQTGYYDYLYEDFVQNMKLWYGISGFRLISKRSDFVSWQVGLTYLVMLPGPIPSPYDSWDTFGPKRLNLIAFPAISYTRKFGRQY